MPDYVCNDCATPLASPGVCAQCDEASKRLMEELRKDNGK